MSVKNVSHHLTIEVVENINQTFCGGQVAGVKFIISYYIIYTIMVNTVKNIVF